MPLAAGAASSGKTGSLALKSNNTGGTLLYLAHGGFAPVESNGDEILDLVNNASHPCTLVKGLAWSDFSLSMPFNPAVLTADFFARAIGSVTGDNDLTNYFTSTVYPDNQGSPSATYGQMKFGTYTGTVQSSVNGAASAVGVSMTGVSIDPESNGANGGVVALAAPPSGALATGGVIGFASTFVSALGDDYDMIRWQFNTNLIVTSGKAAGSNPRYPYLPKGLLQQRLSGNVTIRQKRNASVILGSDGNPFSMTMNFGATGAGVGQTLQLHPKVIAKPSTMNINYVSSTYMLRSQDGTSPVAFTAL